MRRDKIAGMDNARRVTDTTVVRRINILALAVWLNAWVTSPSSKSVARTMNAAHCAAVLLSVPISYHFHGCTALLVALVVVSGAILNAHLYLLYGKVKVPCSNGAHVGAHLPF